MKKERSYRIFGNTWGNFLEFVGETFFQGEGVAKYKLKNGKYMLCLEDIEQQKVHKETAMKFDTEKAVKAFISKNVGDAYVNDINYVLPLLRVIRSRLD